MSKNRRLKKENFRSGNRSYTVLIPDGFENQNTVPLVPGTLQGNIQTNFFCAEIMSGSPREPLSDLDWKISIHIAHGRDDELFPIVDTIKAAIELEMKGIDLTYRILEKTTHF